MVPGCVPIPGLAPRKAAGSWRTAGGGLRSRAVLAVVAGVVVFTLFALVHVRLVHVHQHATLGGEGRFGERVLSDAEWITVFDLGQTAMSIEDFLELLRVKGLRRAPAQPRDGESGVPTLGGPNAFGDVDDVDYGYQKPLLDDPEAVGQRMQRDYAAAAQAGGLPGRWDGGTAGSTDGGTAGGAAFDDYARDLREAMRSAPGFAGRVDAEDYDVFSNDDGGGGGGGGRNEPPEISKWLALRHSVDRTIIVTWANFALFDFVKSWALHAHRVGIRNYLIGAMDEQMGKALIESRFNAFAMYDRGNGSDSGVGSSHMQWGGESFHKMGRLKIGLAQMFLKFELNLLLVDVDVMLLRNVMGYFASVPQADILVSSDNLASTLSPGDEGLEKPALAGAPMNIGVMFFRCSAQTQKFVDDWYELIVATPDLWDQNAFNEMARQGWDPYVKVHPDNDRVFSGYNGTLWVGVLPVALFSGGHTFYIQHLYEVQQVEPYAVHATFQYGGNVGKRNRMREAMIFEDEEEYYTGERYVMGAINRSPDMNPERFHNLSYDEKKAYNVEGLDMQLESVYATIGLAWLLNRTVIMPRIACYCDRYWMPLDDCRVPGATQQRLPFVCPMDYVLDPISLTDDASSVPVRWREYTFLENPRCPLPVKSSRLTIYTSTTLTRPEERYSAQEGTTLLLPASLSAADLTSALAKYEHLKVWDFKQPSEQFPGIPDAALAAEFQKRIDHLKPIVQPMNETAAPSR